MKKQQRDAFRVHHMVQACELIISFTANKQLHDLLTDRLLSSAVERQLEIIGEAAGHVSTETQIEWPLVDWRGMKGARNFIAHEYFRADYNKIWNTIQHIIPAELPELRKILSDLEARFDSAENGV